VTPDSHAPTSAARGIRAAQVGIIANTVLAVVKLVAGIVGNAYALVADAVESTADIFASAVVWGGLQVASREADEEYPFGYGKAEALATIVVSTMLLGAAVGIAVEAIREIRSPHHAPAPWTLAVLVVVMGVKWILARRVGAVAEEIESTAVQADAWHHLSDAVTSAAAFIGISVAIIGGPGWEAADDYGALVASAVIVYNGLRLLRPAVNDLMDRMPDRALVGRVRAIAEGVPEVRAVEKLYVRKAGLVYHCEIHVQADATMALDVAHALGGRVKAELRAALPQLRGVLVHMEPYDGLTVP
jgi:cation diffusion facilitator family transporter